MLHGRRWRESDEAGFSDPRVDYEAVATVRTKPKSPPKVFGRRQRYLVRLRMVALLQRAGMTPSEIAAGFGLSPNRVYEMQADLSRARDILMPAWIEAREAEA